MLIFGFPNAGHNSDMIGNNSFEILIISTFSEQGWHCGNGACLPPMWPAFDSPSWRHMWVEFVFGSLLGPTGFSLGSLVFPSLPKPTLSNSNLILNAQTHVKRAPVVLLRGPVDKQTIKIII